MRIFRKKIQSKKTDRNQPRITGKQTKKAPSGRFLYVTTFQRPSSKE